MGNMAIMHNMVAMNANRMLGTKKSDKAKSAEKLSTGYKINRAADDAAGLAISEKMRKMIRGLTQGTDNAVDGVSWVQIGDGALEEAQAIIHRMTELSVKSANGTNSDSDRAALDEEFAQCKKELERISTTTKFNGMRIFSKHEQVYYQCDGAVKWEPNQMHVVTAGKNDLTFLYTQTKDGPLSKLTVTVPPGEYTTMELLDELDTVLTDNAKDGMQFFLEYTDDKRVNATLEGGAYIDTISGGLSYLIYDMYKGGSVGALIGTTIFVDEESQLFIYDNKNDKMTFTVEGFDGSVHEVSIDLEGDPINGTGYTREELIDKINEQLTAQLPNGPLVEATEFGTGIKLGSSAAIVTGFKGNMFTIDGGKYTSVFYDNVMHGDVKQTAAVFTGGCVLTTDSRDVEHGYTVAVDSTTGNQKGSARYKITKGVNDTLVLQPNESPTPVTLTIDEGDYTAAEMADKLNRLFEANKLGLTVAVHGTNIRSGSRTVTFEGLKITSTLKGPDSKVGLDETCSAYDTLFVSRDYNEYGVNINPQYDRNSDKTASWTGSKTVTSTVNLTSDNNTFNLSYGGTTHEISLGTGSKSPQNIVLKINQEIAKVSAFDGKITAVRLSDGRISIRETDTGDKALNTAITVSSYGTNKGYDTLFQAYDTKPATATGSGHLTLTGTPSSSTMTVSVGGQSYTVNLNGTSSKTENPNKFTTVEGKGSNSNRNFTTSATGKETSTAWSSGTVKGVTTQVEGSTALGVNEPATVVLGPKLKDSMEIKAGENDKMSLTLNGKTKTVTLDAGTYNKDEMVQQLQLQINDEFGDGMGGAIVSLEGDQIRITSRLPKGERGENTSISCSTNSSSFLKDLNTVREPAKATSTYALAPSITIDANHRTFEYQYTDENGMTHDRSIDLAQGSYTPETFVNMLNGRLTDNIQASLSNGKLVLTSTEVGKNVGIAYNTNNGGALEVMFGNLTGASPASIILNQDIQERIEIKQGEENFTVTVNGKPQTVQLKQGPYNSRSDFVTMLNEKLKGVGAEAYLSGNKIGLRTTATGTSASIKMDYANGGSSMKAIFGSTDVEMTKNGNTTTLKVVDANGRELTNKVITVTSGNSGGLLPENRVAKANSVVTGYHSKTPSYIQGVRLNGSVTIDQYNDDLKFTFNDNGTDKPVTLQVDPGLHTYAELQKELQDKIDAQLNDPGKVKVTVDEKGVRLEAAKPGNDYLFKNVSGDFYEKVICGCTERKTDLTPQNVDGTQTMTPVYVVGRQDVRNGTVEINTGINDELSLDLTRPGETDPMKIAVTLDPGKYDGDSLKSHLQDKIDEVLAQKGLKKGLIKVGIGDINSGVAGGNDANALNFSLAEDIAAPAEGGYVIDGVRGNAAFSIFYQTDGEMIPAYIMGTKDVRGGVTIKENETHLTFAVDEDIYEIDLDADNYTAKDLITIMNDKLKEVNAPIAANIDPDTGRVKISHKQMDEHEIRWISGSAKDEVFFQEYGEVDTMKRKVQLSDRVPDHIDLPRSPYSTTLIGVNSLFIGKEKNALKAIDRLSTALRKISELRSKFGSIQNRLEHAIKNNDNKSENLQHSESVIRDTDMAEEMVRFANGNILEQAGISMLSQANQSKSVVLQLLG